MKDNKLIVPEKENLITRFFNWISNLFNRKPKNIWEEELEKDNSEQEYIIPKDVMKIEPKIEEDENSLSYLYKLSDEDVDKINELYDSQMEEAKEEILKLENVLQSYKDSIKRLQDELAEDPA